MSYECSKTLDSKVFAEDSLVQKKTFEKIRQMWFRIFVKQNVSKVDKLSAFESGLREKFVFPYGNHQSSI